VAESNGQDVQVPWFSGLCLEGEVAGQYEMDLASSPQQPQGTGVAGVLALDKLAPITIFVGANNSGKSRLMREMFANSEAIKCLRMGSDPDQLKIQMNDFLKLLSWPRNFKPKDQSNLLTIMAATDVFKENYRDWIGEADDGWIGVNAVSLLDAINATIDPYLRGDKRIDSRFSDSGRFGGSLADNAKKNPVATAARNAIENWSRSFEVIRKSQFCSRMNDYLSLRRCYVPMLRGMRPPLASVITDRQGIEAADCYEERSILDYFDELPNWRSLDGVEEDKSGRIQQRQAHVFSVKPRIFTGLSLYHDIQKRLLAPTYEERKSIRDYELFLSANFFQGREVTLTPALHNLEGKDNDVVHIKIGESEDRPIYALGDGMQSLIICTYPIITELQRGSLFFLEEPDLCMHPSLQRVFLKVLRESYIEKGHQFFLTTHSNHLLDLLEDDDLVSIFSFSEIADRAPVPAVSSQADSAANSESSKPGPRFRIRPSDLRDRRTLLELGVRPSATYLANATIWVEGVSDCAYLRAYMEAFVHYLKVQGKDWGERIRQRLEQYKEDRHYAFVEYSGSNLEHYSFIDKNEDNGQAEVKSNEVTSVTNLCATALVIADGDVHDKGDRKIWFEDQLKERFICLPCKEIENLIPEVLMKRQIVYDHTKPKQGDVPGDTINSIDYASYARSKKGIGAYLCGEDKNILKYQAKPGEGRDSGTLPPRYKTRWRSETEGIPALLRKAISPESSANKPEQNDITESPVNLGVSIEEARVPDYLSHDLIWLCVCIYAHVAKCNHDKESEEALNGFQQFIRDQGKESQGTPEGPNGDNLSSAESDDLSVYIAPEWPINNVSSRNCLLKAFLRSNNAESTPSSNAELNPASTSSAPGAIASPAA
jgi:hypothetical protein